MDTEYYHKISGMGYNFQIEYLHQQMHFHQLSSIKAFVSYFSQMKTSGIQKWCRRMTDLDAQTISVLSGVGCAGAGGL